MMVLAFLLACTATPGSDSAAANPKGIPFPHDDAYKAATAHGPDVQTYGADACFGCHREGATAPTCASCHEVYPHETGWLDGAVHGARLTGDAGKPGREACGACHGAEGLQAPSCTSCHASWPHPTDWGKAGNHGTYVLARGDAASACGNCHGATLAGEGDAPSCTKCHTTYPHAAGWREPTAHGATVDYTECWLCHGDSGATGGTADVSCQDCHSSFPHPADWATTHFGTAAKLGESVCMGCHEAGSAPFPVLAACGSSCHGAPK